ncbi:hypothetical protein GN958_ATG17332 [Phytophthora infestans]|uniref:Uncharacterized protein n=1 Tax=Phytophthora infestans TaxID=4787 RepID=A0A8S9TYF6_PHYIN|nr:hypothetical protein GN958_ATG17332 [Phytophthora infestans]
MKMSNFPCLYLTLVAWSADGPDAVRRVLLSLLGKICADNSADGCTDFEVLKMRRMGKPFISKRFIKVLMRSPVGQNDDDDDDLSLGMK